MWGIHEIKCKIVCVFACFKILKMACGLINLIIMTTMVTTC